MQEEARGKRLRLYLETIKGTIAKRKKEAG